MDPRIYETNGNFPPIKIGVSSDRRKRDTLRSRLKRKPASD